MTIIAERLSAFIQDTGMTKNKFANYIGTSSALISKLTTQTIDFRIDILSKIVAKFPNFNLNWLLTGIGGMYLNTPTSVEMKEVNELAVDIFEKLGLDKDKINSLDLLKLSNDAHESVSVMRQQGKFRWLYMFREFLQNEHPEIKQFADDLSILLDVKELTSELLYNSKIGDAIHFGVDSMKSVATFKDFKELGLNKYQDILKHKSIIHEFASDSGRFFENVKSIQQDINLDFDFER